MKRVLQCDPRRTQCDLLSGVDVRILKRPMVDQNWNLIVTRDELERILERLRLDLEVNLRPQRRGDARLIF